MSSSANEAAAMVETSGEIELEERVIAAIQTVYDPEIPVNVYDLGLIYEVDLLPLGRVQIQMTLTSPACPVAGSLPGDVEDAVRRLEGVADVQVELVWDPPWDFDMMTEDAKLELNLL